jgi:hypothetical protein
VGINVGMRWKAESRKRKTESFLLKYKGKDCGWKWKEKSVGISG